MAPSVRTTSLWLIFIISAAFVGLFVMEENNSVASSLRLPGQIFSQYLCQRDKQVVAETLHTKASQMQLRQFHTMVHNPIWSGCHALKRYGGKFKCNAFDGQKYVCMDSFAKQDCLIYSFGISDDTTFEDAMSSLGCEIHGFDPFISAPNSESVPFKYYNIGLAEKSGEREGKKFMTLADIIEMLGHKDTSITYLKVDIEGSEIKALPEWISSGALANVEQIGMEIHRIDSLTVSRQLMESFVGLYRLGYRLISSDINACMGLRATKMFGYMEVVFKRNVESNPDSISDFCPDPIS